MPLPDRPVAGGGSALGASHKWVGTVDKRVAAGTDTAFATINIDSGSSSVWRTIETAIGALLHNGTTYYAINSNWLRTGSPGNLSVVEELTYQIVAT